MCSNACLEGGLDGVDDGGGGNPGIWPWLFVVEVEGEAEGL